MPESRWRSYGENVARVNGGALGFAAWDQLREDPEEWGQGWRGYDRRAVSEVAGSVVQETGSTPVAVPRIVRAYGGAFARTTWHPAGERGRTLATLISGSTSLGVGALINLAYEFAIR